MKKLKIGIIFSVLLFFNISLLIRDNTYIQININNNNLNMENLTIPETSDLQLPDKVYTFEAPNDFIEFNTLYLNKGFIYFIYLEVVTPHNCSMKITIWDPDNKQYEIFESEMFFEPDFGRWFEIPFGTTMAGGHVVRIESTSIVNFNMLVYIYEGPKVLYDKVPQADIDNLVFDRVNRFYTTMQIEHPIYLETDTRYHFYIGRVNSISILENPNVVVDYTIEDPNSVPFEIYANRLIEDVDGINFFSFGTAMSGTYTIKLKIYCAVPFVNIAYTVSSEFPISEGEDVNGTGAPGDSSTGVGQENSSIMPDVGVWATFGVLGGLSIIVIAIVVKRYTKNNVEINPDKR